MAGYYFIKSNGRLFKLTKKAYQTWITNSTNRLKNNKSPAKLKNYGTDLGEISTVSNTEDIDFINLKKLFSIDK